MVYIKATIFYNLNIKLQRQNDELALKTLESA